MDDQRLGRLGRVVRIKKRWRQEDVANRARVSRATVSRFEAGELETLTLGTIRRICAALEVRAELVGRWRGGDGDRLLNAGHAAMHEAIARRFSHLPGWQIYPEVTYSFFGERGAIDLVAWHPAASALLLVELKTQLVDLNDLMGSMDRRRRLGRRIAAQRGWNPRVVGTWVAVTENATNARSIRSHAAVLRAAFPDGGRAIGSWLRNPVGRISALSLLSYARPQSAGQVATGVRRVRARRKPSAIAKSCL